MDEQDDSKKRVGLIPDVVRNSDRHMYIVREFKEEMRGKKIPDDMVVSAENRQWFTENKVKNFVMKSTPHCPTYGICPHCFGSSPVHMFGSKVQK
jgi:hypothetical protein